jgi:hypothetical protein
LSLNTLSFLYSYSDQIKTIAPILIYLLNLWSIPLSQFPKILVILRDRNKVEATWMTGHIDLAKRYWKNKCLIVSSWWQKTHILLLCQFRLARLSLVRITPLRMYRPNTFIHNGIFNLQSLLLLILSIRTSGWISTLYIWRLPKIYHSHADSSGTRHVLFVVKYLLNVELRVPRYKSLTRQIPSEQHIWRRSVQNLSGNIAFVTHNIIQCWGIIKAHVFLEPYVRSILNGKRTLAEEKLLHCH